MALPWRSVPVSTWALGWSQNRRGLWEDAIRPFLTCLLIFLGSQPQTLLIPSLWWGLRPCPHSEGTASGFKLISSAWRWLLGNRASCDSCSDLIPLWDRGYKGLAPSLLAFFADYINNKLNLTGLGWHLPALTHGGYQWTWYICPYHSPSSFPICCRKIFKVQSCYGANWIGENFSKLCL